MKTFRVLAGGLLSAAVIGAASLGAAVPASAEARVQVGVLRCKIVGGVGFVVGSSRDIACHFAPAGRGHSERYAGTIDRFGIDIGATRKTTIVWGVFAPTNQMRPGALEGTYVGASAEATVGVGVGANALVGGFDRSITLNPISVQTQTGANIAAGVAGLKLRALR